MKKLAIIAAMVLMVGCIAGNDSSAGVVGSRFDAMTPAEHLKYAKQAITSNNLAPAKLHVDAIPDDSAEYKEVPKLRQKIEKLTGNKSTADQGNKSTADQVSKRQLFANDLQVKLGERHIKSSISIKGKNRDTLIVKASLENNTYSESDMRVIFNLINNEISDTMKHIGFTQVKFVNGRFKHVLKL